MASSTFKYLKNSAVVNYRISGSKFIGYSFPASTIEEFENFLKEVKLEHYTATHHCTARIMNPWDLNEFSQDDGEPNGTAGLPILNAMRSENICNACIIVVRYYGGTKLGKSGLIDAYGHTAKLAIEDSELGTMKTGISVIAEFSYDQKKTIDLLLTQDKFTLANANYMENITYEIHTETKNGLELVTELEKLSYLDIKIKEEKNILIYS